jgi:hypothetical protein
VIAGARMQDAIAHGSAKRVNPGARRVCVYRYGPAWGNFRIGYEASDELLERLTLRRCVKTHLVCAISY